MGLIRHYLRVFFRSNFRPINPKVAKRWEINSSIFYLITAWTVLGYSIYAYIHNKDKNKDSPYATGRAFTPYQSMRKFGTITDQPATLIKIRGTSVEREVLTYEEIKEKSRK